MSNYLDKKYLNIISPKLERFKWKSGNLANCRCPFCGDSKKNKVKSRGYFYEKNGIYVFHCHNCSASMAIGKFIKVIDPSTHREYILEKFKGGEIKEDQMS